MTEYVLTGLVKRRAELAGQVDTLRAQLAQASADLGHVDAVIRQFDPSFNLEAIRPKRPRAPDALAPGQRSRLVLETLRRANEPLSVAELVRLVMGELGQDADDKSAVPQVTRRTEAVLARQERQGVLRALRVVGRRVVWEVAD